MEYLAHGADRRADSFEWTFRESSQRVYPSNFSSMSLTFIQRLFIFLVFNFISKNETRTREITPVPPVQSEPTKTVSS